MAQKQPKKENLPVKVDVDLSNGGTISYANEVIATIAGVAANEVDGVAGMSVSGGIGDIWSRNKNITKGVKVEVGSQENVRKALEGLTGLHVVKVDVHVQGVSFEMEKKANENLLEVSKKPVLTEAREPEEPAKPENKPAPAGDAADHGEDMPEDSEFDKDALEEEAKLDGEESVPEDAGAEEKNAEDTKAADKPKKRPRMRIRS